MYCFIWEFSSVFLLVFVHSLLQIETGPVKMSLKDFYLATLGTRVGAIRACVSRSQYRRQHQRFQRLVPLYFMY